MDTITDRKDNQLSELHKSVIDNSYTKVVDNLQTMSYSQKKQTCKNGWSALHYAAYTGNVDILKKLLDDSKMYVGASASNCTTDTIQPQSLYEVPPSSILQCTPQSPDTTCSAYLENDGNDSKMDLENPKMELYKRNPGLSESESSQACQKK